MQFVSVVRGAPVAGQKVAVILSNGSLKADPFRTNSTQVSNCLSACLPVSSASLTIGRERGRRGKGAEEREKEGGEKGGRGRETMGAEIAVSLYCTDE